jgi:hypothetical protein
MQLLDTFIPAVEDQESTKKGGSKRKPLPATYEPGEEAMTNVASEPSYFSLQINGRLRGSSSRKTMSQDWATR